LRSPDSPFVWLLRKEFRELLVSRSWWILVLLMGPLTGVCFIPAMRTYAELSGLNGTAAGVGEAMDPLIGVWGPTFSACELAAVFLLPFAAIRTASSDRQSGALKLELQQRRVSPVARIVAKAFTAFVAWMFAMLPLLIALALWKWYGGTIDLPEVTAAITGHFLNAGLTIGLAFAAASITEHPSSAAIVTLSVTVGTWILNFFAAIQGGLWERIAAFTPARIVGSFQHGLVRLDMTLIAMTLVAAGLGFASIWQLIGRSTTRRAVESASLIALTCVVILAGSQVRANWDLSESRINSFPPADEAALRLLNLKLRITVNLAPEDPRRADLDRRAFAKLRRVVPDLDIQYLSATSIGMFEQTRESYGEIWYEYSGRKQTTRATTEESVLENIYSVAQTQPSITSAAGGTVFRGHPLAVLPTGAAEIFYGLWPGLILLCSLLVRRKFQST
jgi:ABC-2 type transport system permease protein